MNELPSLDSSAAPDMPTTHLSEGRAIRQNQALNGALLKAAKKSREKQVEALIRSGKVDLNVQNAKGATPLHLAVKRDNLPIVKILIAHGADPNAVDHDKNSPLHVILPENPLEDLYRRFNELEKFYAELKKSKNISLESFDKLESLLRKGNDSALQYFKTGKKDMPLSRLKKSQELLINSQELLINVGDYISSKNISSGSNEKKVDFRRKKLELKVDKKKETRTHLPTLIKQNENNSNHLKILKVLLVAGGNSHLLNRAKKSPLHIMETNRAKDLIEVVQKHEAEIQQRKEMALMQAYNPEEWGFLFQQFFDKFKAFKSTVAVTKDTVQLVFFNSNFFEIVKDKLQNCFDSSHLQIDENMQIILKNPPQKVWKRVENALNPPRIVLKLNRNRFGLSKNELALKEEEHKKNLQALEERYYQLEKENREKEKSFEEANYKQMIEREQHSIAKKRQKESSQNINKTPKKKHFKNKAHSQSKHHEIDRKSHSTPPLQPSLSLPQLPKNPLLPKTGIAPFPLKKPALERVDKKEAKQPLPLIQEEDKVSYKAAYQTLYHLIDLLNKIDSSDAVLFKDNETHQLIIQNGLSYYLMRFFECVYPYTDPSESFSWLVNKYVIKKSLARQLRNQIRHADQISEIKVLQLARWMIRAELPRKLAALKDPLPVDRKIYSIDEITIRGFQLDPKMVEIASLTKKERYENICREIQNIMLIKEFLKDPSISQEMQIHAESAIKKCFSNISVCLQKLPRYINDRYNQNGCFNFIKQVHCAGIDIGHFMGEETLIQVDENRTIIALDEIRWENLFFLTQNIELLQCELSELLEPVQNL